MSGFYLLQGISKKHLSQIKREEALIMRLYNPRDVDAYLSHTQNNQTLNSLIKLGSSLGLKSGVPQFNLTPLERDKIHLHSNILTLNDILMTTIGNPKGLDLFGDDDIHIGIEIGQDFPKVTSAKRAKLIDDELLKYDDQDFFNLVTPENLKATGYYLDNTSEQDFEFECRTLKNEILLIREFFEKASNSGHGFVLYCT